MKKKIRFERVSIVKEISEFKVYSPRDLEARSKKRAKIQHNFDYEQLGFEKWVLAVNKKIAQYERTLKCSCIKVERPIWKVIGSDGRIICRFDTLEQAKKYCLKNNLDYGYFENDKDTRHKDCSNGKREVCA